MRPLVLPNVRNVRPSSRDPTTLVALFFEIGPPNPDLPCLVLHRRTDFKDFSILMIGRLLGGIATSLLFSIFEAWLIRSHADAQVTNFLGKSFSWAAYCNSIVAILTGLVANKAAESVDMFAIQEEFFYLGGYLSPFDIALVTSLITSLAAYMTWEENYGESGDTAYSSSAKLEKAKWYEGLRSAYYTTIRSQDILLCGIISSLFEGSMYVRTRRMTLKQPSQLCFLTKSKSKSHRGIRIRYRSLSLCGRPHCHRILAKRTTKVYLLESSLLPLWFAVWLDPASLVSLVTKSKEKSWLLLSLELRLLRRAWSPCLEGKR